MNNDVKNIVRSVVSNNLKDAKLYVKELLSKDKTESNRGFVNQMMGVLQQPAANFVELPHNIKDILYVEDVSISFDESRYYLSNSEKGICGSIFSTQCAINKLSEMRLRYLNSTILYGEPGTGKTFLGRYVAYKLGLPFAYLNFSHCISSYLGATGRNLHQVFDYVKKQPCVLMLDEVDAIGLSRNSISDVGEMSRIVIGLMQALDTLPNDIVLLGATNRMDMLDAALLRRFTFKHELLRLSDDDVLLFIQKFVSSLGIIPDLDDINLYSLTCSRLQSQLVNDIVQKLIVSIQQGKPLKLCTVQGVVNGS